MEGFYAPMITLHTLYTATLTVAGFALVSSLAACTNSDGRPAPSVVSPTAVDTPVAAVNHDACQAGTWRECKLHYTTEDGAQCPTDYELCREDGVGYHECGAYVAGDNGVPALRNPTTTP